MAAYKDERTGEVIWRYRTRITLPTGRKLRISGTPETNTMKAAESAEAAHITRVLHPELMREPEATPTDKPRGSMPTIREFVKRFIREYAPDGKPGANRTRNVHLNASIVPFFGDLALDAIDQGHVNAFKATLAGKASSTVRNKLVALSVLLGYAADLGLIEPTKLKLAIKVRTETDIIALPKQDVAKLIKHAADPRHVVAILLASEAGLRIGEIRGAQWTDLKDGKITVRRSIDDRNNIGPPKNGKSRSIRLSPALVQALRKLPRRGIWLLTRIEDSDDARKGQRRVSEPGGFLGYSGLVKAMHALYKRAGIKVAADVDLWHSLRHTFGTELVARGVPLPTIQRLMDHADIRTTMRYVTTTADQMDAAIERAFGR